MFLCCFSGQEVDTGPERLKMVIVGDGNCGKTCLLYRFASGDFCSRYRPTVFEVQSKTTHYKNQQVELVMYDTAGQEDYDCLRHYSYKDTDVMIICFALDCPDSLDNVLTNWMPEVRYFCGNVPVLLVGNKKDMRDGPVSLMVGTSDPLEAAAEVFSDGGRIPTKALHYEEGLAVARKIEAMGYFESSAKTGDGVDAVFEAVVRTAMETKLKKTTGLFRLRKI